MSKHVNKNDYNTSEVAGSVQSQTGTPSSGIKPVGEEYAGGSTSSGVGSEGGGQYQPTHPEKRTDWAAEAQAQAEAAKAERDERARKAAERRRQQMAEKEAKEKAEASKRSAEAPDTMQTVKPAEQKPKNDKDKPKTPSPIAADAVAKALAEDQVPYEDSDVFEEDLNELPAGLVATGYLDPPTGEVVEHKEAKAEPEGEEKPKRGKRVAGRTRKQKIVPGVLERMNTVNESRNDKSPIDKMTAPTIEPHEVKQILEETSEETKGEGQEQSSESKPNIPNVPVMDRVKRFDEATNAIWGDIMVPKSRKKSQDQILKEMIDISTDRYQNLESAGSPSTAYPDEEIFEETPIEERTREDEIEYDKHIKIRELIRDFIKYPWKIKIEGETLEVVQEPKKNGAGVYRRVLNKRCREHLELVANWFGDKGEVSLTDALCLVLIRGGITIDTKGNIGGVPADEFVLPEETLVRLCRDIDLSMKKTNGKNPFAIIPGDQPMMGNTRCYPLGYCPSFLIHRLRASEKSPWYNMSLREIQEGIGQEWLKNTLSSLVANTEGSGSGGLSQRWALFEAMRALLSLDGATDQARAWGITAEAEFTALQMMNETSQLKDADGDPQILAAMEERDRNIRRNVDRLKNQTKRKVTRMEEGRILDERWVKREGSFAEGCHLIAAMMRSMGLVGNVGAAIGNFGEKWKGNSYTILANKMLMNRAMKELKASDYFQEGDMEAFVITDYTKDLSTTSESKEVMEAVQLLAGVGGIEALQAFSGAEGMAFTKKDVKIFLNQMIGEQTDPSKKMRMINAFNNLLSNMMAGNYGTRGIDNKRMLEMFMINMAMSKKNGKRYIDAAAMDKAIASKGYGQFIKEMMAFPEMTDAFLSTTNFTTGRINPAQRQIQLLLKRNGLTDLVVSTALDTYTTYGVNVVQAMLPFSNTLSYLALHNINQKRGTLESDMSNYQLGGLDEFRDGLAKNMIYDAMKFGDQLLTGLLFWGVIELLGIDEPPEDYNIFDWVEYSIGGNLGDGSGVKVIPSWWINDLVGWGLPFGMALAVTNHWGTERGSKVFWSGVYDMTEGSSVLDMLEIMTHSGENAELLMARMGEDDYMIPDNPESFFRAMVEHYLVAEPIRKLTPYPVNNLLPLLSRDTMLVGDEARDRSATKVYDRENYDAETAEAEQRTTNVEDYQEIMRRRDSKSNFAYAIINNLFHNHQLFDDGTTDKTGYAWFEMPIATRKDPVRMVWYAKNDFDYNDAPQDSQEERTAWLDAKAEDVLADIDSFTSPEQAVANGFALSFNARTNAIDYCYRQIALLRNDYVMKLNSGEYADYTVGTNARNEMNQRISKYYDYVNNWLKSDAIPWRDAGYERLITDWNEVYTYEDGSPATEWAWMFAPFTGENIKKEWVPRGNHPTSFLPFTTVDPTDRGYNEETINNWYVEGLTDLNFIHNLLLDTEPIDYGQDAGRYAGQVIFGGQGDLTTPDEQLNIPYDNSQPSTLGQRSYVPSEYALPDSIKNMTQKDSAAAIGIDMDQLDEIEQGIYDKDGKGGGNYSAPYRAWTRYGGRSSSYSGGTSFNPKIYSNPRSVNADYAKGMSVRQPYGATKTYLRPNFETKGSREAYRRSDF